MIFCGFRVPWAWPAVRRTGRGRMHAWRALLFLVALGGAAGAQAYSFQIADLRVEGLQRVSAGSVFAAVPVRVGDRADPVVIQNSIRALFRTGFFDDIAVYRDGDVLVMQLSERPAISEINLEGNKVIKDEDLLKSLRENGLAEGQIFKPATLDGMSKALSREYVSQGLYGATLETEIRELPRNRIAIDITIDEGKKAKVKAINLVGNQKFSDAELLDLFESRTSGRFTWLTGKDRYAREKLAGDLETLESHYLDRGYIRFNIDSTQVSVSPDKRAVYITVNVTEGEVYRFGEIDLLGELVIPERALRRYVLVREGQDFSQARVSATVEIITERLGNEGYSFAEVREILDIDDEAGTVNTVFFIDPQKRTYVRRIEFRGNTRTAGEVLRRELRQFESSVASDQLIDFGKVRLDRLGFFKEVESEVVPVPGTSDQVDVIYTVEEQPSGSVSACIGFTQNRGAILGLSLQENNFLGSGNRVGISVQRSTYRESLSLSYTDPYFTEDGISAGYSLFARNTDFEELDVATYSTDARGFDVSYSYPTSEISRLSFSFGYENIDVEVGRIASDEIEEFVRGGRSFDQLKLSGGWGRSTLNRGVFATRGSRQRLNLEAALPGSDAPYVKVRYDGRKLVHLTGPWTMRFTTELGWGQSLDSGKRLPFFENYYAGGFGSVRGFESNTLGPRESPAQRCPESEGGSPPFASLWREADLSGGCQLRDDADPIGGNVLISGSAELLLPLPFLPDQRSVQATAFVDAGNVFDTDCGPRQVFCFKPSFDELRYSYGVGLTWLSGFGPLSFALGRGQNGRSGGTLVEPERTEFFQFSLGQTF